MQELIDKLQSAHGLTAEQSKGILGTITGFIKEKFPMVSGAIDNLFQGGDNASTASTTKASSTNDGTILDKISDFVPGATGQKIEDFAKDKLGGFFKDKNTPS